MGEWNDRAKVVIDWVHQNLPEDTSLAARIAAVDAAYPFGQRTNFPYKAWLKDRRAYLCKYGFEPRSAPPESPLERMMRRSA